MSVKNKTNFWDFANNNPEAIFLMVVFICATILGVTYLLTHNL